MTPEQILQINEQMAKMLDYTIAPRYGGVVCIRTGEEEVSYWQPDKNWNQLIRVYNACHEIMTKLSYEKYGRLPNNSNIYKAFTWKLEITNSYRIIANFVKWVYDVPAPGTQSPDRTIPDGRR